MAAFAVDPYGALPLSQRQALTTMVFHPRAWNAASLAKVLAVHFPTITVSSVRGLLGELMRRRLLVRTSGFRSVDFKVTRRFDCAMIRRMAAEADERNWWPDAACYEASLAEQFADDYYKSRHCSSLAETDRIVARGLRLLALAGGDGAAGDPFVKLLGGATSTALARITALRWISICTEQPELDLTGKASPIRHLVPFLLNLAFIRGRDVRLLLNATETLLKSGRRVSAEFQRLFAALAVWTGQSELLANPALAAKDLFIAGCRLSVSGDFAAADKVFKSILDSVSENWCLCDAFPCLLLMSTVCAVAKPEKIAKIRPAVIFSRGLADCQGDTPTDRPYREAIENVCRFFADGWRTIHAGNGELLAQNKAKLPSLSPLAALALAWDWRMMSSGRASEKESVLVLLVYALSAEKAGYLNFAGLILTLIHGGYDPAALKESFAGGMGLTERVLPKCLKFLPVVEPEPEWKSMVKKLRTVITRASRSAQRDEAQVENERFFWVITLYSRSETDCDDGICRIGSLSAVVCANGADEGGSADVSYPVYRLDGKNIQRLMSEHDRLIAAAAEEGSCYGDYSSDRILPLLCGIDNLLLRESSDGEYGDEDDWDVRRSGRERKTVCHSIQIERRACELESEVSEDGGLSLRFPRWLQTADGNWLLRKTGETTYACIEISKEARQIINTFDSFGANGRLELPREAVAEAKDVVTALTALFPVAEPTGEALAELRRVPAAVDCRVRLDFEDGVLRIEGVVLPVPGNDALALQPGLGQTEKVIASLGESYVLVRDLAAEQAAFDRVRTAFAAYESWFDGKTVWAIGDIAAAIAALDTLKALEPAVPLEWMKDRRLRVTNAPASHVALVSRRTADDWFHVEGNFTLDDGRVLSVVQMLEAVRGRVGNYVRLSDGDYARLSQAMTRELDALDAASRRKGDGLEIVRAAVPMLDGVFGSGGDSLELPDALIRTAEEIRAAFARKPEVPVALEADLRPYQIDGYRWLSRLAACGFGSCLADDMGLGKTLQVIALLLERAKEGPSLVIAPASVCGNWRSEIHRFAPTLRSVMAWETLADAADAEAECAALAALDGVGTVVIASYGYLLFHERAFTARTWNGLILDEAQAIKNDTSRRARLAKEMSAKFRVAATGTPVENRLGELWSIFDFLNPGLLGSANSFALRFTEDGRATPGLKRLVKPLILRRLKGDVLDDLPEKTEVTVSVTLGADERAAYEGCRRHALAALERNAAETGGAANRISILAELTRLRRFCCHPSLVLPGAAIASAKMEALVELLDSLRQGRHRALVFSQFTDYLAIVRQTVTSHGWSHLYLDGSTPLAERERLVNAFQGGEGDFFLISLKAGGTGLNLTAANYVILLDPWWNPAVENQAADRAHRIGQRNPVTVYRLIAADTVEERVVELHREKKEMTEDVLDGTGSSSLTPEVLMKLFG